MKVKQNKETIDCHIPITMCASNWGGKGCLLPNSTYTLICNYPLTRELEFKIKSGKKGMTAFELIGKVGKIYEDIFDEHKEYEHFTHKHGIEDLKLSGIDINHTKLTIKLGIDS